MEATLGVFRFKRPQGTLLAVPRTGVEPVRVLAHWCLRPARLPIPPPGRAGGKDIPTMGFFFRCRTLRINIFEYSSNERNFVLLQPDKAPKVGHRRSAPLGDDLVRQDGQGPGTRSRIH